MAKKDNKVKKKSDGYGYKYADLEAVNDYIAEIGGSYYQFTRTDDIDHQNYVWTHRNADDVLDHAVEIRGAEVVPATLNNGKQNPAQAAGSAMTYARRYSLYMAYGIACVDDDAESLTIPEGEQIDQIARDFPVTPITPPANKSAARAAIVTYCNEHGIDLYTIREKYGIVRGMAEDILQAKLELIKKDHGA